LKNGKSWIKELSGLKLVSQNGKWHSFSELYLGIPEGFEEMFDEILNMRALHRDNNSLLLKYPRVTDLLVKFGLNKFDLSSALHGFIRNVIRLSGVAGNEYVNQFWHFLFLNRDVLNADGSRLVNDRFKLFPIRTIDGNFEVLERCV